MDCNSLKVISHRLAVAGAAAVLSCEAEARLPSERLLKAIRQVETEDGRTSANVYQLRAIAVYDVNRIYGTGYRYADVFDRHVARRIVRKYLEFRDWAMSHGYEEDLTLDRINPENGYYPENCQWVTKAQQQKYNKRNSLSANRNWRKVI